MTCFIDVILPIPLEKLFTYKISEAEADFLKPGMRVAVPFGKSKIYTALVYQLHSNPPVVYEAKEIDQILDETPIITSKQLEHWFWLSEYYMCTVGEVFRAAVPSAFLLESETVISKNECFDTPEEGLEDDEWLVFEALQHQSILKVHEISSIVERKNVLPVLKRLLEKNIINIKEEIYEQYKPRLVKYVKLHSNYTSDEELNKLLDQLSRANKQKEALLSFFSLSATTKKPVKAKDLEEKSKVSNSVLKALVNKNILEEFYIQKDRINYEGETEETKTLNEHQENALSEIKENFKKYDTVLLHGITSSGKTEVYVKLIEEIISKNKQVLYLLPEIALTTQLISRLQNYFGEKVSVYHSKYSVNERVEVWNNLLNNSPKARIIIGARSSVLLPFTNLGLIVVDEEHEVSFKQFDPAPRYHARDAAVVLAKIHGAKVLMGSATPSIESYYNTNTGKYGLVEIKQRFGNVLLPDMELVDLKEKYRKKLMKGHFSDRLTEEMEEALSNGEQIILFQNRRGYAPIVECNTCGHSPQCPNCDVSLTFHQYKKQLRCHYCSYSIALQPACMACGSSDLDTKGFGTEQVEEEVKQLFPDVKTARMDSDTTRGKYGYEKVITAFEQRETDVLVGTQMLTKGLDFDNVSLVGIMNADTMLNFPDFRAHERCFQLIQQVAGRSGRAGKRGKVIIQTYNPYHQIMQQASMNKYTDMFTDQINERRQYKYPPFYRLIKISFKHKDYNKVNEASYWFSSSLRNMFGRKSNIEILGPEFPPVSRIRNEYIKNTLIKIPPHQSIKNIKAVVKKTGNSFNSIAQYRSVRVIINVDNY
ncbi:replication restart helicase PriA [Abyssalbus ytuae]|uniref:Replication restart protein PriA n=1 Tax=Abyssalbus ytuae TaxID=2926907 RepID=A0A9E6ZM38_9FLAO|nr:primosomal protein N' [Abyssalbus ytuae]UOB17179.1 primosomal protein N' [Abyssalbus ytuae]